MDAKARVKKVIGISDFKRLIDENCYFVDKSMFIKHVWNDSNIILIPRPRRFGKTLNLSMLRYFFEKTDEDRSYLFKNLKIWQDEEIKPLQGKFPVVFITLKDEKHNDYQSFLISIKNLISELFQKFTFVEKNLSSKEQQMYEYIIDLKADNSEYEKSLKKLSEYLSRYYNKTP